MSSVVFCNTGHVHYSSLLADFLLTPRQFTDPALFHFVGPYGLNKCVETKSQSFVYVPAEVSPPAVLAVATTPDSQPSTDPGGLL